MGALSPGHQNYGNPVPRPMGCIHDGGLLLVFETQCKSSEVARKAKRRKFMPHANEEKTQSRAV